MSSADETSIFLIKQLKHGGNSKKLSLNGNYNPCFSLDLWLFFLHSLFCVHGSFSRTSYRFANRSFLPALLAPAD